MAKPDSEKRKPFVGADVTDLQKGDRVDVTGLAYEGTLLQRDCDGRWVVLLDGENTVEDEADLTFVSRPEPTLMDEVQVLVNRLVSAGHDNKRLLSRKVAQLLQKSGGRLTRGEKLQAAAMLLVSAGLSSQADASLDDG